MYQNLVVEMKNQEKDVTTQLQLTQKNKREFQKAAEKERSKCFFLFLFSNATRTSKLPRKFLEAQSKLELRCIEHFMQESMLDFQMKQNLSKLCNEHKCQLGFFDEV